ncbi:FRAP-related family protein, partial [Acanthamoeba castellanii str. Neff]
MCLGEMGAIDPGRLELDVKSELHRLVGTSNTNKPLEYEEDDEMAFQLISSHLLPAFRAARDTRGQDRAAFAIQEVLKLCGCTEQTPVVLAERRAAKEAAKGRKRKTQKNLPSEVKRGVRFWRRFSEDVRELMMPFLSSQYVLQAPSTQPRVPIYPGSKDYQSWVSTWAATLIQRVKGPQADLFQTCRGVVKDDLNTAHFLLPYLVLSVLRYGGEEDNAAICAEFLAVLEDPSRGKSPSAKNERSLDERSQMNTATIFSLIDLLNNSGTKNKPSDVEHVEQLLAQIPQLTLAQASLRCRTYTRALLHFELHLRKEINLDTNRSQVALQTGSGEILAVNSSLMQKIYTGLDEPDGLKGIATLRASNTLRDHIVDLENSGKWRDAFMCYDQRTSRTRSDVNCLLNLGQLETMLNLVTAQLASHRPDRYEAVLMSYGVQAAWRLGKWDILHKFLSPHLRRSGLPDTNSLSLTNSTSASSVETLGDSPLDFEVAIGGLVSAIKRQDDTLFQKLLEKTRAEVMGVLSAASMESYQRAYPYITKLHMLHGTATNNTCNRAELLRDWQHLTVWYARAELEQSFGLSSTGDG